MALFVPLLEFNSAQSARHHCHRACPDSEKALRARGVVISDPVQAYDEFYVGSFLDSEAIDSSACLAPRSRSRAGVSEILRSKGLRSSRAQKQRVRSRGPRTRWQVRQRFG
jgi:hypothetical protein